jgi:hypothetical protein
VCIHQEVATQICTDPVAAGERMVPGIGAGGDEALLWVYAFISGGCPSEDAPTAAYQASSLVLVQHHCFALLAT